MFGLGTKEIIIVSVILLFLFGSKKITELAQTIVDTGKSVKKGFEENSQEDQENKKTDQNSDKIEVRVNKKK